MKSNRFFVLSASVMLGAAILGGCQTEVQSDIPTTAMTADSGNSKLNFTAPSDGRVWIYDAGAKNIVYSGKVNKGDSLVVDPDANLVTLNGTTIANGTLTHGDMNQIRFQPVSAMNSDGRSTW